MIPVRKRLRRGAIVLLLCMVATLTAACAHEVPFVSIPHKRSPTMSKAAAEQRIRTLYAKTVEAVGNGWKEDYLNWQPGGDFDDGTPFDTFSASASRRGDLGRSPQDIAEAVAAAWFALGYPVTVESDDTIRPPQKIVAYPAYLTGKDETGFSAEFSVGQGVAYFMAESPPYPGTPYSEDG